MENKETTKSKRKFFAAVPVFLVLVLLVILWQALFFYNKDRFAAIDKKIEDKSAIVLSSNVDSKTLIDIILNNGYAQNNKDASFIADTLIARTARLNYARLFDLQKRYYGQISAVVADSFGILTKTLQASCDRLGQNDTIFDYVSENKGEGVIKVLVTQLDKESRWWQFGQKSQIPVEGVPVRLQAHIRDSMGVSQVMSLGYVYTNACGTATFNGLDTDVSYSVLPVKKGFEYGGSKGTKNGVWEKKKLFGFVKPTKELVFSFVQNEHRIPMFSNAAIRQMKSDKTILIRSSEAWTSAVTRWMVTIIVAWLLLCLVVALRKGFFDGRLIASGFFLTTLSVLVMFSLQDPLTDQMYGSEMAQGVVMGVVVAILFQLIDFEKFYQDRYILPFDIPLWLFQPFKQKVAGIAYVLKNDNVGNFRKLFTAMLLLPILPLLVAEWVLKPFNIALDWTFDVLKDRKNNAILKIIALLVALVLLPITLLRVLLAKQDSLPKGIGWIFFALLLTALLWTPLGQAIGGMKVNLNVFGMCFQPSEIAKFLIILFFAAFFTQYADTIIKYSCHVDMMRLKIKTLRWVIVGLMTLMVLYLALGDMGPGFVLGITFILLYSVIKSKVGLDNLDERVKWRNIFTCDFAMLVYGVISFALFVWLGGMIGDRLLFAVLWFLGWIAMGWFWGKRFFETAFLMNLIVFAFVFGGVILTKIPALQDTGIAERFDARTRMCQNPWGDIDIEHSGDYAQPVSNTQIANGLWALASGGMHGQGWTKGSPTTIPAYHTDMILASIGEQLGWIGLLAVLVTLAIMLRRMILAGYRTQSGHPFTFYMSFGIAIVTAVQFFVIALGSSGLIPLTGITVPYLSYGRVSMIFNLTAFGMVLSFSQKTSDFVTEKSVKDTIPDSTRKNVEQYDYPTAIVSLTFIALALITAGNWFKYQSLERSKTLVQPVFVVNTQGDPVIEYNPRITMVVQNMNAGRIYDCNGILLATSDKSEIDTNVYKQYGIDAFKLTEILKTKQRRYYPMDTHVFFMLGDFNRGGSLFKPDESNPIGYMAEYQHLAYLRGFDNILRDKNNKSIQVRLASKTKVDDPYLPRTECIASTTLRDYSFLLDILKEGIDGETLRKHNDKVKSGDYDLHLTIDAALQAALQDGIANFVGKNFNNNNLLRISAVVLDAKNGNLIAAANYPLPNYDTVRNANGMYSDNNKPADWHAYTDRDLATTYQTFPGSTAKVMSAMAGLRQYGKNLAKQTYYVSEKEIIERGSVKEPCNYEVSMHDAIKISSNCYFINLVNDKDLYYSLDTIYKTAGLRIGDITPYYYVKSDNLKWSINYDSKISENREKALRSFNSYCEKVKKQGNAARRKMNRGEWKWAWGQGYGGFELLATPLNMARIASIVANNGVMPVTQYLVGLNKYEDSIRGKCSGTILMNPDEAFELKGFMKAESEKHKLPSYVAGKTGTPEREIHRQGIKKPGKCNDGWYMMIIDREDGQHPLAAVVRLERLPLGTGSKQAVKLTREVLLPVLKDKKMITTSKQ